MSAALVLSAGGARGAYEAGVLLGLATRVGLPFQVISGTSAGAINAGFLAAHAHEAPADAMDELARFWSELRPTDIARLPWRDLVRRGRPCSLLDPTPLGDALERIAPGEAIEHNIDRGLLDALVVTTSELTHRRAVAWLHAKPSRRAPRGARRWDWRPACVGPEHILASSAVPLVFRPVRLGDSWHADGAVLQYTPLAPTVRLGATRIVSIVTGSEAPLPDASRTPPGLLAQLGDTLETMQGGTLAADLEQLEQINALVRAHGGKELRYREHGHERTFRPIESLVIRPSRDLESIAAETLGVRPAHGLLSAAIPDRRVLARFLDLGLTDAATHAAAVAKLLGVSPASPCVR